MLEDLNGWVRLLLLPPGCPDLSAIERLWMQMKMAVLTGPYVKFKKMCSGIGDWLDPKYIYRSV